MGPGFESQPDHDKESNTGFLFSFMPATYILYSAKLDKYYVGACTDIQRRLYEHNLGHSTFTSTGVPWELKFTKEFSTLQEAKQFEGKIKRMKSRKYIEGLVAGR